jgi:hypothetical protein
MVVNGEDSTVIFLKRILGADEFHSLKLFLFWLSLYSFIQVFLSLILSSLGAFFHFLLDHNISIIENWIYQNAWILLICSKALSFWFVNKLLLVRMYRPPHLKTYLRSYKTLDRRVIVLSFFILLMFVFNLKPQYNSDRWMFFVENCLSFVSVFLWFFTDLFVCYRFADLFLVTDKLLQKIRLISIVFMNVFVFKLTVPDYHQVFSVILFFGVFVLSFSGGQFKKWLNSSFFIFFVVAPLLAFCGLDPFWGHDFSLFLFEIIPSISFLLLLWVISFIYYQRQSWGSWLNSPPQV